MPSKTPRRRIVVGDRAYTWELGREEVRVEGSIAVALTLLLRIHVDDDRHQRVEAVFHGQLVPFLFTSHEQSLMITPSVVRRVIEVASSRGWPTKTGPLLRIDPAQDVVPEASIPLDVADAKLRSACSEWFVPYPGRAALQAAWTDCRGDLTAMSQRLDIEPIRLAHWLELLGIAHRE
jgi:hypothetical protein